MIQHPTNFPQPSVDLSGDSETPVVRTDIDNGLIQQFGRFATGKESFSASWVLSQAELTVFEEWFNEELFGGVLVFGLMLPEGSGYSVQPVRFVGGSFDTAHKDAFWFTVTAEIEKMIVSEAPTNRTLPVAQWVRLGINPALSQNLTFDHRNALLTSTPGSGNTTTFRIYPPTDPTQYIYFGLNNQGAGETLITSEDVDPPPVETVPSWPGGAPNINRTFRVSAKRKASRLDMDGGHPRQWAGLETTVKGYEVEWDFTLAQLQTFHDFFYTTLKSGSSIFWLPLPLDGMLTATRVRFVGGRYSQSYIFNDTFKVTARLDVIVEQTVLPSEAMPWPMYYAPLVEVAAHRKVTMADAGTLFHLAPAAGQTINLHIASNLIEFGLLITGLGNVLVTRTPFVHVLTPMTDTGEGAFGTPTFELRDTIKNLGSVGTDTGSGEFLTSAFELRSVVKDIGTLTTDTGSGEFLKPAFEMLVVLEDIGTIATDTGSGEFLKTSFILDIP
jgi:hypothetical protein